MATESCLRRPWPNWSLPLFCLALWLLAILFFNPVATATFFLLGLLLALTVLLLLGQGGCWLVKWWDTPIVFRCQRYGRTVLLPLLFLHFGFALPGEGGPDITALWQQQSLFIVSLPLLALYCWLSVGWSGLYDYNPLVLQLSQSCLYGAHVLIGGQLLLLSDHGGRWLLALLILLPLASRLQLWLQATPFCLVSQVRQGDGVLLLRLAPAKRPLVYQAGQFVYVAFPWRFPAPIRGELPLSLASAPADEPQVLVRINNPAESWQHQRLRLRLRSAQGYFFRQVGRYPWLFLVAAGLGISPFVGLLDQLSRQQNNFPLELHWFIRQGDEDLLAAQRAAWQQRLPQLRICCYTALTRAQIGASLAQLLAIPDREGGIYFCGPVGFNRLLRQLALEHEWPPDALHYQFI